jgi:hypothetical protein
VAELVAGAVLPAGAEGLVLEDGVLVAGTVPLVADG